MTTATKVITRWLKQPIRSCSEKVQLANQLEKILCPLRVISGGSKHHLIISTDSSHDDCMHFPSCYIKALYIKYDKK